MTAAALLADAAATLAAAGVASPEWDAERLLRHVLGWDRAALFASPEHVVPRPEEERFRALVRRRASREPLQYILGRQAFWKHEFLVTPAVLIPRPETELLVEVSLELLKNVERPLIVDVGTGSGCVALSLAFERPDAEIHATDISGSALEVAGENARRLGLEDRVTLHQGDLLEPVVSLSGKIDLVVSNPPYVDPAERASLASEVREHEPAEALFAPEPGASVYSLITAPASALVKPGGWLAFEVGQGTSHIVRGLCHAAGLAAVETRNDLAAIPRVVVAQVPTR
jgi:release factor glutamine methyltransferase